MMRLNFKCWGLLAALFLFMGSVASAKVERKKIYIFGFSASFTDSLVYITEIQTLNSAFIDSKTGFLKDRPIYSDQLQSYIEDVQNKYNTTCAVFFSEKKSKLTDTYNKIKKDYTKDHNLKIEVLPASEFGFVVPVYEVVRIEDKSNETSSAKAANRRKR